MEVRLRLAHLVRFSDASAVQGIENQVPDDTWHPDCSDISDVSPRCGPTSPAAFCESPVRQNNFTDASILSVCVRLLF